MFIVQIIYNLAILVTASIVSGFIDSRWNKESIIGKILQGITFGLIAILAMLNPYVLEKGIIFDGRSVVLSLSALFFGPISGIISGVMAIITRMVMGGGGSTMGVLVISTSVITGIMFNYYLRIKKKEISKIKLYLFGLAVHIQMILLMSFLPTTSVVKTFQTISLTVIIFYPLVTLVIGRIIIDHEKSIKLLSELKESEENLSITLHSIGDAVISTDIIGNITQMNPVAEKLCGWKFSEAQGRSLVEVFRIVNALTGEVVHNPVKLVLDTGKIIGLANHTILISKNGSEFQIADSAAPIKDKWGNVLGVVLVFSDVSAKYAAQKALEESESKFRKAFTISPDAININRLSDGVYVALSNGFTEIMGYTEEDIIGHTSVEHNIWANPEDRAKLIKGLKEDGLVKNLEARFRKKNGSLIYGLMSASIIELNGEPHILSITRDIDDRKRAENEYRKLSKAVQQSPAAVVITDLEGKTEYANPKTVELTGFTLEELINGLGGKLNTIGLTEEKYNSVWETINSGKEWHAELLNKTKSGTDYWVSTVISPILNDKGEIIHFLVVQEDITEKKEMINALIKAKEKAEGMNQLKSNFLANMSHELRTPLNGILGYAEILSSTLQDPEYKEMTTSIYSSGKRLSETLNLILDLSKAETDKAEVPKKDINIAESVSKVVKLFLASAAANNLTLETKVLEKNVYANLDDTFFVRIINNLISNAVKFTLKGRITVEIGKEEIDNEYWAYVKVQDTGIGIPEDKLDVIWEEFRQVSEGFSRSFDGTGLGLTMVKRMTELMDGIITVESKLGEGSIFTVKFLASNVTNEEEEIKEKVKEIVQGNKDKQAQLPQNFSVLYVEDDKINQHVVSLYLKGLCKVDHALNGKTALMLVSEKKYHLILMDINLGEGMDGIAVTKKIRQIPEYADTPIVAITAYAMEKEKEMFLSNGCTHFLAKPFGQKEVIDLISFLRN